MTTRRSSAAWLGTMSPPTGRQLLAAGLFVGTVLVVLDVTQHAWLGDFEAAYYPAGRNVFVAPDQLYDSRNCIDGFVNLPVVAVLFLPLSVLPYRAAIAIFTAAGVAAVVIAMRQLIGMFGRTPSQQAAVLALFAVNGPLWDSVRIGNLTHFLLPVVLLALGLVRQKRFAAAGGVLGAAAILKIPIGLFGLYFLIRRRWSALASMTLTVAAIAGLSVLLFGPTVHAQWIDRCIAPTAGKVIPQFNVQSVDAFLARAEGADPFSWQPTAMGRAHGIARLVLIGSLLLILAWMLWRDDARDAWSDALAFSAVLTCGVLAFPVSWMNYYLFLLLPLSLFVARHLRPAYGVAGFALVAITLVAVSLPVLQPFAGHSRFGALVDQGFLSHYFLGGVLLLGVLVNSRHVDVRQA